MDPILVAGASLVLLLLVGATTVVRHRHHPPAAGVPPSPWVTRSGVTLLDRDDVPDRVRRAAEREERLARHASARAARYLALVEAPPGRRVPRPAPEPQSEGDPTWRGGRT